MSFMKKKWVIFLILFLLVLAVPLGILFYAGRHSLGFSTGRYFVTDNGSRLILIDDSPVCMSNCSKQDDIFNGLQSGDLIRILHDGIDESYPGSTGVYFCKKLADGTIDDLPPNVRLQLSAMGWNPVDTNQLTREIFIGTVQSLTAVYQDPGNYVLKLQVSTEMDEKLLTLTLVENSQVTTFDDLTPGDTVILECATEECATDTASYREVLWLKEYHKVSCSWGYGNMMLSLDADWEYEIEEYDPQCLGFGIRFWHRDCQDCSLRLAFYPDGFGVCGTGLETKEITLPNGLRGVQGTYDNRTVWDHITFPDLPGDYVLENFSSEESWEVHGEEVMDILRSMTLAEGSILAPEATEIAARALQTDLSAISAWFDGCDGEWHIRFRDSSTTYTVLVGADGTVHDISDANEIVYAEKPVIYLYPQQETAISVRLDYDGVLTSSYPSYKSGWNVIARPDGTLTDPETGREYYCLFWEGISNRKYDLSTGFVVAGEDTESFLEEVLSQLGLNDREANEFIIYWLPRMEGNSYNLISFQWENYTESAALLVEPAPDSILRIFMAWKKLDSPVDIPYQTFPQWERTGFSLVEWGGAEIRDTQKT